MAPKPDVSDQRRNQILQAARDTFADQGFHKTRMSDIAEKSGLSKGALYWYFESKDAIILSLLDKVFEPELKEFKSLLIDQRPVIDRLYLYADRAADDISKMLNWMPLVYDFIALAFRREIIKNTINKYYRTNVDLLEYLIQQGIDSGDFKTRSARDVAIAVSALIEGTVVLWFYDPENISIRDHIQSNLQLLIDGIKKDNDHEISSTS